MRVQPFGRADFAPDPARRGFHLAYREGELNRCPGCGRSHWYIGRLSAECCFCGTALPLTEALAPGTGIFRSRGYTVAPFASAA